MGCWRSGREVHAPSKSCRARWITPIDGDEEYIVTRVAPQEPYGGGVSWAIARRRSAIWARITASPGSGKPGEENLAHLLHLKSRHV